MKIKGTEPDTVMNTRYLGVNIDSSLDWKDHKKAISSKVSRAIGFLKHGRSFLPQDTLKTLYTGIVEPHFRYCCSVWGYCGKTDLNQLQKFQNRAARIVTNSCYDAPSKPLLHKLEWKSIEELIADETKMTVFTSLTDFGPKYVYKMFTKNSRFTERNLRNTTTDLMLPLRKSSVGQKSFSYRGAKLWNSLLTECKETRSLQVFKPFVISKYKSLDFSLSFILTFTERFIYFFLLFNVIIISNLLHYIVVLYSFNGGPLKNQLC